MQLSKRLGAVAALVTAGGTVADIGTDHAYIPIYLIRTGAVPHAIAMDVNPGPLARAREHIAQYGLEASIETRLSDGLAALRPGEADSIVIAGMGGALMLRILEDGFGDSGNSRDPRKPLDACRQAQVGRPENLQSRREVIYSAQDREPAHNLGRLQSCRELILQPQSEIWLVRAWLDQNGWQIVREDMVCEDGKFYPMMRAERCRDENDSDKPGSGSKTGSDKPGSGKTGSDKLGSGKTGSDKPGSGKTGSDEIDSDKIGSAERVGLDAAVSGMSEMDLRFGPLLLRDRHPVLREFLLHEKELNLRILASLAGQTGEAALARAEEVRGELRLVEEALEQIRV